MYERLGIRNGDVVREINGFEMTSPDRALDVYSRLKEAESIVVDLTDSNGRERTMEYHYRCDDE
ncbi:MAG: hypothetical protein HYV07_32065 [Deltaproteobacteria bacterium]|nr:hypothetical protein [Deltaproteobacteria bacterium]